MAIVVPPGGFAGFAQMTQASQRALGGAGTRRSSSTRKRSKRSRKSSAARSKGPKRRRGPAKRGKSRLVKGSAAAKQYMAKLRKLRKR